MAGWSELQGVDEIDVGRYFEYDADAIQRLGTWLGFIRNSAECCSVFCALFRTSRLRQQ